MSIRKRTVKNSKIPADLFENDTLWLLIQVYNHRGEVQTEGKIASWCGEGFNQQRVSKIIRSLDNWGPSDSYLARVAHRYGIVYKVFNDKKGLLIDVSEIRPKVCFDSRF